jgi:hypothetical protein
MSHMWFACAGTSARAYGEPMVQEECVHVWVSSMSAPTITDEHIFITDEETEEYMPLYSSVPRNIKLYSLVMCN